MISTAYCRPKSLSDRPAASFAHLPRRAGARLPQPRRACLPASAQTVLATWDTNRRTGESPTPLQFLHQSTKLCARNAPLLSGPMSWHSMGIGGQSRHQTKKHRNHVVPVPYLAVSYVPDSANVYCGKCVRKSRPTTIRTSMGTLTSKPCKLERFGSNSKSWPTRETNSSGTP